MGKVAEYKFKKKVDEQLVQILAELKFIKKEIITMSVELDDLVAEVEETEGVEQSAIALLQGIVAELEALIAANEAGKVDAAKLVELKDSLHAKAGELAAAVAAVPPAPVP